jgi:hypothetical protein
MQFTAQDAHYRRHYPTTQYSIIEVQGVPVGRLNRPYYFKQNAYEYEQEVRFVLASEPVHLATEGGIVRKVNASKYEQLLQELVAKEY